MTKAEVQKELEPLVAKLMIIADEAEVDARGMLFEVGNFAELLSLLEQLRSLLDES